MPPVRYRIDPPILRVHIEAPYEDAELGGAAAGLLADPDFVPGLDVLAEIPRGIAPPSDTVRSRVELVVELAPHLGRRIALVVRREVDFGLGRMFGTFAEEHGLEVRLFREVADAEAWLRDGGDGG
jgi:hypothetical protein